MADVITVASRNEDDLSDEQMQELLAQAAKRRQEKASLAFADEDEAKSTFNFPKLNTGEMVKPYVDNKGDVATLDAKRLLGEKDRKLSEGIRKVEDPVAVKKKTLEVSNRTSLSTYLSTAYEENIPKLFPERSPGTVLVAFLHY